MIRQLLCVAKLDLMLWLRSPSAIAAALLPALGMGALVAAMTITVGQQPVALVQEASGRVAGRVAHLLQADDEAYRLTVMDRAQADAALRRQQVAAAIVIPPEFDDRVENAQAEIELYLNNVTDTDLADDIRREITRTLAELDAPQLGIAGERFGPSEGILLENPFRVAIAERDLRDTDVSFFQYQVIPILVLLVLSAGLLGSAMLVSRDFQRRTAKILVLSPAPRTALILGKLLGGIAVTLSFVLPVVAVLAGTGLMRPPSEHWPAIIVLLLALVSLSVSLGLFLGVWVRNDRWVGLLGLNLSAYLFFLGGGFSTVAFLPEWLQKAASYVPTSYAVAGLRQALFYPDLAGFSQDLGVVCASAFIAAAAATAALSLNWAKNWSRI